jgi:hypothetical protein
MARQGLLITVIDAMARQGLLITVIDAMAATANLPHGR